MPLLSDPMMVIGLPARYLDELTAWCAEHGYDLQHSPTMFVGMAGIRFKDVPGYLVVPLTDERNDSLPA